MSDFEQFCAENNIPFKKVTAPIDRLLLHLNLIRIPISLMSFPKRSLILSIAFAVGFIGLFEALSLIFLQMSLISLIPPQERFLIILLTLAYGIFTAIWIPKEVRKNRDLLQEFVKKSER